MAISSQAANRSAASAGYCFITEAKRTSFFKKSWKPSHFGSLEFRYDNLRSATAEEGLICTLLREPELIANVKLPAEAFSVDLFGRVLADLRQRVQSGRPVSLAALGPDLTPEEMAHLSYVMSRDTAPVSDEAFADYLRVIQEEYEGRSLTRSEENLRLLAEQMKSTKQYGG